MQVSRLPCQSFIPLLNSLSAHNYDKRTLYSIAKLIGEPLKLDASTSSLSRSNVVRFCVKVVIKKPLLKRFWIGKESNAYWQYIHYENILLYCTTCNKLGHESKDCCINNPNQDKGKQPTEEKQPDIEKPSSSEIVKEATSLKEKQLPVEKQGLNASKETLAVNNTAAALSQANPMTKIPQLTTTVSETLATNNEDHQAVTTATNYSANLTTQSQTQNETSEDMQAMNTIEPPIAIVGISNDPTTKVMHDEGVVSACMTRKRVSRRKPGSRALGSSAKKVIASLGLECTEDMSGSG
ncbi:hypothetical protein ACH5RR_008788 [Cinchona calisaya]|uniref:CCHC-type domain-containing protein n=1 Tax=Cinchona calisaya TaxID=153742 RepID=A0ABD3AEU5_9GENT